MLFGPLPGVRADVREHHDVGLDALQLEDRPEPHAARAVAAIGAQTPDVAAGTYKVKDKIGSMCYWAILRTGSNGEDIIANDLPTGGYPSVTLKKGQDFENQCGTWTKVG